MGRSLAEAAPRLLRHIAEVARRIDDPLAGRGIDIGPAIQGAGDGADGNAEPRGEIANALSG